MYYRDPVGTPLKPRLTWPTASAIGVCSSLTLLLGLWAGPIYSASRDSAEALVRHPEPVALLASTHGRAAAEAELRKADEAAREAAALRGLQFAPRGPARP
jgi:hypothetical protein